MELEEHFYMGTGHGQALRFGSQGVGHNDSHTRFLAGVVNLNEQNRRQNADYAWVELQLGARTFVVYPLSLDGFGMFVAISYCTAKPTASAMIRMKIVHICSALQAYVREHLLFVLESLDLHARRQADRGAFADSVAGSAGEELCDLLGGDLWAEHEGEQAAARRRRGAEALRALGLFEGELVQRAMVQGAQVYAGMFAPLQERLGELGAALGRACHFCVCSCEPSAGGAQSWAAAHMVYSSAACADALPPEFMAAIQAYARRENQGWGEEHLGKSRVLLAAVAGDGVPSMMVTSCGAPLAHLVLALQLPESVCVTEGHAALCAKSAGNAVRAWPLAVLPAWLVDAWQETLRRLDRALFPRPATPGSSNADSYSAMFDRALAVSAGQDAPATPASRLAAPGAALWPASPASPGGVGARIGVGASVGGTPSSAFWAGADAPKASEMQTPARVPAPPAQPKSSAKGGDGSRGGRALQAMA